MCIALDPQIAAEVLGEGAAVVEADGSTCSVRSDTAGPILQATSFGGSTDAAMAYVPDGDVEPVPGLEEKASRSTFARGTNGGALSWSYADISMKLTFAGSAVDAEMETLVAMVQPAFSS